MPDNTYDSLSSKLLPYHIQKSDTILFGKSMPSESIVALITKSQQNKEESIKDFKVRLLEASRKEIVDITFFVGLKLWKSHRYHEMMQVDFMTPESRLQTTQKSFLLISAITRGSMILTMSSFIRKLSAGALSI